MIHGFMENMKVALTHASLSRLPSWWEAPENRIAPDTAHGPEVSAEAGVILGKRQCREPGPAGRPERALGWGGGDGGAAPRPPSCRGASGNRSRVCVSRSAMARMSRHPSLPSLLLRCLWNPPFEVQPLPRWGAAGRGSPVHGHKPRSFRPSKCAPEAPWGPRSHASPIQTSGDSTPRAEGPTTRPAPHSQAQPAAPETSRGCVSSARKRGLQAGGEAEGPPTRVGESGVGQGGRRAREVPFSEDGVQGVGAGVETTEANLTTHPKEC